MVLCIMVRIPSENACPSPGRRGLSRYLFQITLNSSQLKPTEDLFARSKKGNTVTSLISAVTKEKHALSASTQKRSEMYFFFSF